MIILVGFMGCGKSTLGPLLALCRGLPFLDLDREVERRCGLSVAQLFGEMGEEEFRRLERETFRSLPGTFAGVLAVGGGLPCQQGMALELAATGCCLYLDTDLELIVERLQAGDAKARPLLQAVPAGERGEWIRALHARRAPCYRQSGLTVRLPAGEAVQNHLDRLLDAVAGLDGLE